MKYILYPIALCMLFTGKAMLVDSASALYPIALCMLFTGCLHFGQIADRSEVIFINETDYDITIYHTVTVPARGRETFRYGTGHSDKGKRITKDDFSYKLDPRGNKSENRVVLYYNPKTGDRRCKNYGIIPKPEPIKHSLSNRENYVFEDLGDIGGRPSYQATYTFTQADVDDATDDYCANHKPVE